MIVIEPSRFRQERMLWIINLGSLILSGMIAGTFLVSLFSSAEPDVATTPTKKRGKKEKVLEVGIGPMALNGMRTQGPVPPLTKELMIAGRNSRPDAKLVETPLLLGLKSTHQEKIAVNGEKIYLSSQNDETFQFSSTPTSLCIQPMAMEGGVLIHVVKGEVEGEFILRETKRRELSLENEPYIKVLKEAKGWGFDLFIQNYGGHEYQDLQSKWKIDFGKRVCFVGPGDLLSWEEEEWRPAVLGQASMSFPLAKVKSVSSKEIHLEAWDTAGFSPITVYIPLQQTPLSSLKIDEMITSVKPRTTSQLSCLLGKRRVVIKEGDWWLKTETGWKNLRTLGDIENFLYHRLRGELFIFSTVSAEKGKATLKGTYFDSMRTQMSPMVLVASTDKKAAVIARKREKNANPPGPMLAKTAEDNVQRPQMPQYHTDEMEEMRNP
jgi:hypothetical protein